MTRAYVIAATPRSGSFLLCEGLARTGVAGYPQEYAAREDVGTWRDHHGFASHTDYFARFPALCTTPNGVFGAKLMWFQYHELLQESRMYLRRELSAADVLRGLGGGSFRVVRLTRGDRLRQAVSWVRAQATGAWSAPAGHSAPRRAPEPRYDAAALASALALLERQERNWDRALGALGAPTLRISYEQLAADYERTVREVLAFLELPWDGVLPAPVLQRQSDELTEQWVARACRELGRDA